jgi:hypothetical protein
VAWQGQANFTKKQKNQNIVNVLVLNADARAF